MVREDEAVAEVRTELAASGSDRRYTLVIEPWGMPFVIEPGDRCKVVSVHDTDSGEFEFRHYSDYLVVWINRGGATFEFWRGDRQEY